MRVITAGPLTVRAVGGNDRAGGGDGPAIVLLHGYGVPGNDLVLLARRVHAGAGVRWFFPEGPRVIDETARAWYPVDHRAIQARVELGLSPYPLVGQAPAGLTEAAAELEACLAALTLEHGVVPAHTIVGGFSQGAVMATELVLQHRPLLAGAALMSGRLLDPDRLAAPLRALGPTLHVLQTHGTRDEVIPLENGRALRDTLQTHGAALEWLSYDAGHAITSEVHAALATFCLSRLSSPSKKP